MVIKSMRELDAAAKAKRDSAIVDGYHIDGREALQWEQLPDSSKEIWRNRILEEATR